MRILLVDDEDDLRTAVRSGLRAEGYEVDDCADGLSGLQYARASRYDAIVLDLMLPHLSGYRVTETLRNEGVNTPILILTAKLGTYDQTDALDSGADDYLSKPFSYPILLARLRALIRRSSTAGPVLRIGTLELDRYARTCHRGGTPIMLTPVEFQLAELLAERDGAPVSKTEILDRLWPGGQENPNLVEARVSALRRKIDIPFSTQSLITLRGVGYRLVPGA